MSNNNCGCSSTQSQSSNGEFLLVKATGKNSSTCGDIDDLDSANSDCVKQEPMFDFSKSDLIIPLFSSSTQMEVCNSDIYSISMWVQFLNPVTTMMISNITGNILTLSNRCSNGQVITTNPAVGTAITRGTRFVVCDAPICETDQEQLEITKESIRSMTELCLPLLEETSSTSTVHPLGRVESDSNNSFAGKCVKRIKEFYFKNGIPFFTTLNNIPISDNPKFKKLARNPITNEIAQLKDYSEHSGTDSLSHSTLSILSTGEKVVGPVHFSRQVSVDLFTNTSSDDFNAWPISVATEIEKSIDLSDQSVYDSVRNLSDHVWMTFRLDISPRCGNFNRVSIIANGIRVAKHFSTGDDISTCSYVFNMKIKDNNKNIELKFNGIENFRLYYRLTLLSSSF